MKSIESGGLQAGRRRDAGARLRRDRVLQGRQVRAWRARASRSTAAGMAKYLADLVARFPIVSIEDGMAEDDWAGLEGADRARSAPSASWSATTCSSPTPSACAQGIEEGIANSILVKVNQIGSLTETLDAVDMAQRAGYTAVMSHRSGETEDATIADLAVATNCRPDQDRLAVALGPARQVQPADPHRGGAGRRGALCRAAAVGSGVAGSRGSGDSHAIVVEVGRAALRRA